MVVGDCAGGGGAAEEPGSSVPVVGIDGTDRLPGSGWRVHNQVSMTRNLRFRSHDAQFPPINARHPFRVPFLERGGTSPPNCFFKLYAIVHPFNVSNVSSFEYSNSVESNVERASNRLVLEIIINNIIISIGLTDLCGCFDRDAILVDEKVTGAARFIDAIAMFPFSKTKHVR